MKTIKAYLRTMSAEDIACAFAGKSLSDCTKQDQKRVNIALQWIAEDYKGDGLFGCIIELFACSERSPKQSVSTQNKKDTYIRFRNGNGNIDYIPAEVKTNGGRIGNMSGRYTIYMLAYTQKHKGSKKSGGLDWEERRLVKPVVIPTKLFIDFLYTIGAVKSTNGKNPEPAIQASSKVLYEALQGWCIPYKRTSIYSADDFEGLEL